VIPVKKPKKDLVRCSRPPLARMMKIHQALKSGSFPNATRLATQLEISTKSVYRDIDFMRDRLELPIDYDDQRFGYFYTEDVNAFPSVQLTEGELVALLIAEKALQQYRGTHFEKPLLSAFRKITDSLPDSISLDLSDVGKTISFRTSAESLLNLEVFDALARAVTRRQQLILTYRKPGTAMAEERPVDPYHLANINGEWFLFAYCHLRNDIRTFVPSRIQGIRQAGKTFVRPAGFSLDKLLRGSFGVYSGEGQYQVIIRFSPKVADYIREKRWHPSQLIRSLKNGSLEVQLQLSSLTEVQRWILSWGGDAIPIKPPELVAAIRRAAQSILSVTDSVGAIGSAAIAAAEEGQVAAPRPWPE
jgi:predicted DNA-binding transcriptional regulator YafY